MAKVPEKSVSVAKGPSVKASKKKSSPTRVASASPAPAKAAPARKSYRVRTGDTLYQIALKHGTTVAEILAINSLGGGAIRPGDQLAIPPKK